MADNGNRMLELLHSHELNVYVLHAGRVGGTNENQAMEVTIQYSSALAEAIASRAIEWVTVQDIGYEVAASRPGVDDVESLQHRRLYERQGRLEQYDAMVTRLKNERREYLASFPGLDDSILKSIR